jgi:hypothetical protein
MPDDNILAEREFDIPLEHKTYKVKAVAVFAEFVLKPHAEGLREHGLYHWIFYVEGQFAEMTQPDKTQYLREEAKQAAESALNSGRVKEYIMDQLQSWIWLRTRDA